MTNEAGNDGTSPGASGSGAGGSGPNTPTKRERGPGPGVSGLNVGLANKNGKSMGEQPGSPGTNGGKSKDLSHVPCKFFKVGACAAGKSCPFSHNLPEPGQGKSVCQWFVKGNCKFGHKCALAHILPGQSMSMDRKNKRAAQAAAREAANNGGAPQGNQGQNQNQQGQGHQNNPSLDLHESQSGSSAAHKRAQSTPTHMIGISQSGIAVSAGQSVQPQVSPTTSRLSALSKTLELQAQPVTSATSDVTATASSSGPGSAGNGSGMQKGQQQDGSALTAMQSLLGVGRGRQLGTGGSPSSSSSTVNRQASPRLTGHQRANGDTGSLSLSPGASAQAHFLASRGGVEEYDAWGNSLGRNRKESFKGISLSPTRRDSAGFPVIGTRRPSNHEFGSSPPLPAPLSGSATSNQNDVFGTSPFSAPGSKSVFFSQSYDTTNNEGAMLGKSLTALDELRRQARAARQKSPHGRIRDPLDGDSSDEERRGRVRGVDVHEEDFLPSSLSELLTPDEMDRRRSRQAPVQGQQGPFDPFNTMSRSVPADSVLGGKGMGFGAPRDGSKQRQAYLERGNQGGVSEGIGSDPMSLAALAEHQSQLSLQYILRNHTQHHVGPSSYGNNSPLDMGEVGLPSVLSPPRSRALAAHAPGSSLPQGLAAGLSRLHFQPAVHTGETPPSSSVSAFGQSPPIGGALSPPLAASWASSFSGLEPPSPQGPLANSGPGNVPSLKLSTAYPRRMMGFGQAASSHISSPLAQGASYHGGEQQQPGAGAVPRESPRHLDMDAGGVFDMDVQ